MAGAGILKVTYQFVLYNTPTEIVERTLLWLEKAVQNARIEMPEFSLEVIVGDCSSTQITSDAIWSDWKSHFLGSFDLNFIYFDENLGHGGAQNRLSSSATGDYLIFANPDILVSPNIFGILAGTFENKEKLAALDAKQLPFEHPKDYDILSGETPWCSGAFFMVTRKSFLEVGGFDHESFYMHGDDVDLSWRLKLAGYQIAHQPAVVVNHSKTMTPTGTISSTDTERKYAAESALILAYKWSRNDLVEKLLKQFLVSDDEFHNMAAEKFSSLKQNKRLPRQLDPFHKIAVFTNGNYAKHRWP